MTKTQIDKQCEKCLETSVNDLLRGVATDIKSVFMWIKCSNCGDEQIQITLDPGAHRSVIIHQVASLDIDGLPVAWRGER
jgi:uncharacterized Zn finger protein